MNDRTVHCSSHRADLKQGSDGTTWIKLQSKSFDVGLKDVYIKPGVRRGDGLGWSCLTTEHLEIELV